jgi:integrase
VSLLLDLGDPPPVVREIVGHADIGVTMQIHAHASLEERRRAMDALGGSLRVKLLRSGAVRRPRYRQ